MNHHMSEGFVCFTLQAEHEVKTFQVHSQITSSHLFKLIIHSFGLPSSLSASDLCFRSNISVNVIYDFYTFYQDLEILVKTCQVYNLVVLERIQMREETSFYQDKKTHSFSPFLSPNDKATIFDPFKNGDRRENFTNNSVTSPKNSNFFSLDKLFFEYLTEMLDEGRIEGKQYYFLKCIYFEQRGFVMDFVLESLNKMDYLGFTSVISGLLSLKNGENFRDPSLNNGTSLNIEEIIESAFSSTEAYLIKKSIKLKDPLIISCLDLYEDERDEEDLIDTLTRFVIINQKKSSKSNLERNFEAENKITDDNSYKNQYEFLENDYGNHIENPKKQKNDVIVEYVHINKDYKDADNEKNNNFDNFQAKNEENEANNFNPGNNMNNLEKKTAENSRIQAENAKPNHSEAVKNKTSKRRKSKDGAQSNFLEVIFKTFLEETEDQFENHEIGYAKFLFSTFYPPLIEILNTAATIETAVSAFKALLEAKFNDYLLENFNPVDIDYIQSNKSDRNHEIFSLFLEFKDNANLSSLTKSLISLIEVKKGDLFNSGCSQTQRKFSSVAVLRPQTKKNSFKMLLIKDSMQTINIKNSESETPLIVTINQGDNPLLKDLLHKYHIREDLGKGKIAKNKTALEDLKQKCNIVGEHDYRLNQLLERNHYGLLKVLNQYEKFNKNHKKVKKELDRICQLKTFTEFPDVPNSPCLRNKLYKLNAFKQVIHELLDRYQLISSKQQKLYIYLYMEEDLVILGAFELYLLTEELQDFIENLRIIDKYHFFKTKLDLDEIEQFDENIEYQLSLLFAYKKYLNSDQFTAFEKIIRAGDNSLIELFQAFKDIKEKDKFIKEFSALAEEKSKHIKLIEQKMMESRSNDSIVEKNLETLETFKLSKFLKKVKFYELLEEMVRNQDKLIRTLFEIYEMTKDKAEFIENVELIYLHAYKTKCKEIIKTKLKDLKLQENQKNFLYDCIELDIPNILAPFEIYLFKLQNKEENEKDALKDLKETISICLRQYEKEIILFNKEFYK